MPSLNPFRRTQPDRPSLRGNVIAAAGSFLVDLLERA